MSSEFIEPGLSRPARDVHRALASLQEELEAIDYYHQRLDQAADAELKAVLAHNRDDEMEHAAMLLEWLRRTLPEFDLQMRALLFTAGSIPAAAEPDEPQAGQGRGLGLGDLR